MLWFTIIAWALSSFIAYGLLLGQLSYYWTWPDKSPVGRALWWSLLPGSLAMALILTPYRFRLKPPTRKEIVGNLKRMRTELNKRRRRPMQTVSYFYLRDEPTQKGCKGFPSTCVALQVFTEPPPSAYSDTEGRKMVRFAISTHNPSRNHKGRTIEPDVYGADRARDIALARLIENKPMRVKTVPYEPNFHVAICEAIADYTVKFSVKSVPQGGGLHDVISYAAPKRARKAAKRWLKRYKLDQEFAAMEADAEEQELNDEERIEEVLHEEVAQTTTVTPDPDFAPQSEAEPLADRDEGDENTGKVAS